MKNKAILSRLNKYLKKYKFSFIFTIILSTIYVASSLAIPYFVGKTIDILNEGITKAFYFKLLIIFILIIVACCSLYFSNLFNNYLSFSLSKDLRKEIFNKIHDLPLSYLDKKDKGDIISLSTNDIDSLNDGLLLGFNHLFTGLITIIISLVIMLFLNWLMGLIVVLLTPISLFISRFISRKIHKHFKKQADLKAIQSSFIEETIPNQTLIKNYLKEEDTYNKFLNISNDLKKTSFKASFYSSLVNPSTRAINALIYALIILIGSLILTNVIDISIFNISLSIGLLVTFLSYASQFAKPFNDITSVITELQNAFTCAERVFNFLDEKNELNSANEIELTNVNGNIEFINASFSYNKNKPLIKNLNASIKKGSKIAIVGPTGAGKTTLINLLMRFYDLDSGSILIDNNQIYKIKRPSIRKKFGMVLQDTWIRNDTVLNNITLGRNISLEKVIEASKKTCADEFISKLKEGYNTVLSENGDGLSTGQKQLLCITRVMADIPPMLILDEATSSIDTRTELKIQNAFIKMMEDRTTFIVAHRLSTIQNADLILVINNGEIVEKGTHKDLLNKKGFYYNLYSSQFK